MDSRTCGHLSQPEDYGGEGDDRQEVSGGLFVSGCDAPKLFQLGEAAFDEMTFGVSGFVERVFDGARWIVGNDGYSAFFGNCGANGIGIVGGVGHDDVGVEPLDKGDRLRRVASLAGGEDQPDRAAQATHGQMDLGAEPAARPSDSLILSPPFAPLAC